MNEVVESPLSEEAPVPSAKKGFPWRRIAAIAGSVLLLGAVIGGTGYTVVTVQGADRDPGRPSWKFPKADADEDTTDEAKGLRALLMPWQGSAMGRGPDLGEFGSDAELSGRQATALRKEAIGGLPPAQRRELEKQIDRQRIKGIAMRSYIDHDSIALYANKAAAVSVVLTQMESRTAVRDISRSQNEFLAELDIFRKGPEIDGHKEAKCFLSPRDEDEKLDEMICSAYRGDVLVQISASAAAPMGTDNVATFIAAQLDRIDNPGKAV